MESNGQNITTYAGTGVGSYSGDGGPANLAGLNRPLEVHVDGSGDIYFADNDNHVIRKIDIVNNIITTVAGTGSLGFSGDGGLATNATFSLPTAVCTDHLGNIFISDKSNQRIRKVDHSTGIISTIAGTGSAGYTGDGGPATTATLSQPHGMQTDSVGNLYFADRTNHVVRRIDAVSGIITTVAGMGTSGFQGDGGAATAALLNFPMSVCLDDSGNIFIADQINHRIRKVDAITGIITTIAGIGSPGFSGDGGSASLAELNQPYDVTIDASGDLYISDTNNQRIRKITAGTGIISTYAGIGTGGFSGDGGPATSAQFNFPSGINVSPSGTLYIGDKLNHRIRKVSACTSTTSNISETACFSYTTPSGNNTYYTSGIYTDLISNATGCDSVIVINLTIFNVDTSVTVLANTITSNSSNGTYQWLNCDSSFSIISGAINQSFTPSISGNYAVQVTENGCIDTSACTAITLVGLSDVPGFDQVYIYPNPSSGLIYIDLVGEQINTEISLTEISGKMVYSGQFSNSKKIKLNFPDLNGVYLLHINTGFRSIRKKIYLQ